MTNQQIINQIVNNMKKMTEWQATSWLDEMRSDNYGKKEVTTLIDEIWKRYKGIE